MMRSKTLPLCVGSQRGGLDSHVLDLIIYPNQIVSIPIVSTLTGEKIVKTIGRLGIENYVISRSKSFAELVDPVFCSVSDALLDTLIQNKEEFLSKSPLEFLYTSRHVLTKQQRMNFYVYPLPYFKDLLQINTFKAPVSSYFKQQKKETVKVSLPNNYIIDYELRVSNSISKIHREIYEHMREIFGTENLPSVDSYRFGTKETYHYPSSKSKFEDVPECMEALKNQHLNPHKPYFAMFAVARDSPFVAAITEYAKELDLSLPPLTPETQEFYAYLSKVREEVEAKRIERMQVNPLLCRMRMSSSDPPLFTCTKNTIAMKCELRSGITDVAVTGASIKVEFNETADNAIRTLINKIENHHKTKIEKDPSEFVLVLQGTDEVIAGDFPLEEFVCIRQFLLSNQPVINLLLVERASIVESIRNKELAAVPLKEPDPSEFVHEIKVGPASELKFDGMQCLPHISMAVKFSVTLRGFKNVTTTATFVQAKIALINGTQTLCEPYLTKTIRGGSARLIWNEVCTFPLTVKSLPRTVRLSITLVDIEKRDELMKKKEKHRGSLGAIASANYPLFTHDGYLSTGHITRRMWHGCNMDPLLATVESNEESPVIVDFELPQFKYPIHYSLPENRPTQRRMSSLLRKNEQDRLMQLEKVDPLEQLTNSDKNLLWANRAKFTTNRLMLPLVLQSVDYTSPTQVAEIPYILSEWEPLPPTDALTLLDAKYPDHNVRKYAVERIEQFNDSELMLYMLQLVQALKYELYDHSPLVEFLIRRGLAEPKFLGHQLFWQLMSEAHLSHIRERFSAVVVNFMYGIGSYREELLTGYKFTQKLVQLNEELCKLSHAEATEQFRQRLKDIAIPAEFHLPMDPRLVVDEFIIDKCKVMNSKKKPFWLTFKNAAPFAEEPVRTMFKVGDDLRQDQLTLQMLKVMEHLWRRNQMDLRMNCYGVLPTGNLQGFIEVVPNSVTEMELQQEKGRMKGVFDKEMMIEFLRRNNPTDAMFVIARENFLLSCAGYAVSTCILGVADRHPGNIMVQNDGHFFHIDFGHFLGNFKKKLGYQREDAPFHFSPACAVALDGPGSAMFARFEETCGRAYNILRENANLLISMMLLMMGTGIPELQKPDDIRYMKDMMRLQLSEAEAVEEFKKFTQMSKDSTKTTVNSWIHNLVTT